LTLSRTTPYRPCEYIQKEEINDTLMLKRSHMCAISKTIAKKERANMKGNKVQS